MVFDVEETAGSKKIVRFQNRFNLNWRKSSPSRASISSLIDFFVIYVGSCVIPDSESSSTSARRPGFND